MFGRRRIRGLAAAAAMLVALATLPASVAQASPTELRRVTTFRSEGSASTAVVVPRKVTFDASSDDRRVDGPNPDVRISGSGAFVGVAFVNRATDEALLMRNLVMVGRWDVCDAARCPGPEHVYYVQGNASADEAVLLPGEYDVHVIAERGPVEITLRLAGAAPGSTTIVADGPAATDLQAPTADVTTTPRGDYLARAGSSFDAGSVGFSVSLMYVRADRRLDQLTGGVCQINGPVGPPHDVFGPQCFALSRAGLGPGYYNVAESVDDREYALMPLFSYAENDLGQMRSLDGRRGLGAWVATPYPLQDFRFAGVFVRMR